mgnify:CR=1 FL=1|jgi:hypothetical protein
MRCLFSIWAFVIDLFTLEWILAKDYLPNGGAVIALRAIFISVITFCGVCIILTLKAPARYWNLTWHEIVVQAVIKLPWFGIIFGFVYAALYARFAAQWTYLANLYNQIKQAETNQKINKKALAEWKAAFVVDADNLHLLTKPLFASVVKYWARDKELRRNLKTFSPDEQRGHKAILARVIRASQT